MKIKMEVMMKDGTVRHEVIEAKDYKDAHQKMHEKYKDRYSSTLIDKVIA